MGAEENCRHRRTVNLSIYVGCTWNMKHSLLFWFINRSDRYT